MMRAWSANSWLASVAVAALCATPIDAQLTRGTADDQATAETSSTAGRAATQRTDTRTTSAAENAASDQIEAKGNPRYSPDEIAAGSQNQQDERRDADASPMTENDRQRDRSTMTYRRPVRIAVPSEFETFASQVADKPVRRFGANLLVPSARDFTAPPTTTVPQDYRINPGDRLLIGLTGSAEADNLRVTVDSEGRIFIPRVGAVRVGGLRYGDIQSAISSQVARQYRNARLSVSVQDLHGITVYVTGFALTPGSYTISSLSTLVNAVLAAGGPSAGGSFRSIQLRRNGKLISDFDLYDFLLKGDKSADALLQNGDVIYVAPVGAQAAVIGSVNNEAVFEARPTDTLNDLLLYAGGVNTAGDTSRLLALDPLDLQTSWHVLTPQQASSQLTRRAQVLRVLSDLGIARPLDKQGVLVTVSGEVARPGRYFLPPGTPIDAVIQQAGGLTPQAYVFGTVFLRESLRKQQRESYDRAVSDVNFLLSATPLTSALSTDSDINRVSQLRGVVDQLRDRRPDGRLVLDVAADTTSIPGAMTLQNNDSLYVPPRPVAVGVFGMVPGATSYQFRVNATIGDYLRQAGGVQKIGDRSQIFVVRANGTVMAAKHGLFKGGIEGQRALPGDLIYVPINPSRGEFWRKLSTLTSTLFSSAATTAAVVAVSK